MSMLILLVIYECYANKCIGERIVRNYLDKRLRSGTYHWHDNRFGRDRVIKELHKRTKAMREKGRSSISIGFIDYEKGVSRVFLEKRLVIKNQLKLGEEERVLIGVDKEDPCIIYVVFDPRIEEALLQHIGINIRDKIKDIKSKRACSVIEEYTQTASGKSLLSQLATMLEEVLCSEYTDAF